MDVATSDIAFEFSYRENDDEIIECGVQIMTEEAESSSSKTEGSSNQQRDGAVRVSKDENDRPPIKHTYVRKRKRGSPIEARGDKSGGVI